MGAFRAELQQPGVLRNGASLQSSWRGWRVRYSDGKRTVTDGPLTETKVLIAGFTLIQVQSHAKALEWTRRFPNPAGNEREPEIEVRQLYEIDELRPSEAVERMREMDIRKQR